MIRKEEATWVLSQHKEGQKGGGWMCVSFINNLPEGVYWRWLKQSFEYHGKVIETFIPKKRSINGKRFGFVRYANMYDGNRAINRINEFWLMRSHIDVNML